MGEVVGIPGGVLAFVRQTHPARGVGTNHVGGEAAREGELARSFAQTAGADILSERNVQAPVQAVFAPRLVRTACRIRAASTDKELMA
ncbi:MAG: hypothetical protein E6R14_10510 [Thermomicrobiales bacterium]|nr:MAG: hypothetical protein E6R14_10510 [Thermomicrobiales bacterium]